eukprot:4867475-Amphidinium_carterae.1
MQGVLSLLVRNLLLRDSVWAYGWVWCCNLTGYCRPQLGSLLVQLQNLYSVVAIVTPAPRPGEDAPVASTRHGNASYEWQANTGMHKHGQFAMERALSSFVTTYMLQRCCTNCSLLLEWQVASNGTNSATPRMHVQKPKTADGKEQFFCAYHLSNAERQGCPSRTSNLMVQSYTSASAGVLCHGRMFSP